MRSSRVSLGGYSERLGLKARAWSQGGQQGRAKSPGKQKRKTPASEGFKIQTPGGPKRIDNT